MKDEVFGLYDKCPYCGKSRGLYYCMQYPLYVYKALNNKIFKKTNGKRKYNLSNKDKALIFDCNQSDFQVAICACEYCGWTSKTITQ